MLRLIAIQTVLISVILVGCKDNAENHANTAVPNASLYDIMGILVQRDQRFRYRDQRF